MFHDPLHIYCLQQLLPHNQYSQRTEIMHQHASKKPYVNSTTTIEGKDLKVVDKSTYLSSTFPRCVDIDHEVDTCIAKRLQY